MSRRGIFQSPDQGNQDDSYDPYANRSPAKPLSYKTLFLAILLENFSSIEPRIQFVRKFSDFKALANLVKSAVGTGLFAMPNAFASVGLVIGIIGTILMGLLVTVSLHMLLEIHHRMCVLLKRPILEYDEVVVTGMVTNVQKPWLSTRVATYLIDVTILTCYIGIGAVYVVFVSGIVQECFDTNKTIDQGYYSLMLLPLFFLINMVKYLSDIAIISIVGNVLLFIATAIGMIYALKDGIGTEWVTIAPDVTLYSKFIGTAFFSMSSPGLVLAIEHDMKKPQNYRKYYGILSRGMMYITLLHVFVGAVGYLKWGDSSLGNFLRNHPENDPATLTALVMQAFAIYFTYGLQCYMPIYILYHDYIMPAYEKHTWKGTPFLWDVIVRLVVCFVTCSLAALVPKVDLFLGLVGAVCTSSLATLIPVSLYMLVNYNDYGKYRWKLILGMSLLSIGIFITLCAIIVNIGLIFVFCKTRYVKGIAAPC